MVYSGAVVDFCDVNGSLSAGYGKWKSRICGRYAMPLPVEAARSQSEAARDQSTRQLITVNCQVLPIPRKCMSGIKSGWFGLSAWVVCR